MALSWKHVVPWSNRSEFVQTYLDLYSKNADRQRKAVETVALWKCRASNKLSVAIESSAALTNAYLKYQSTLEAKKLHCEGDDVRSLMTLAIIRFVSHVTEKGQNKAFAQPIHKIAKEFGIPEWIVRIRHEGSHSSLPPLDMLIRGVQWALTYLQEVFWSHQVKEADEESDPSSRKRKRSSKTQYNMEEIQTLLHNYQKSSYKSLGEDADSEAAREKRRALRRIEHILKAQERNNVLRCLVESGQLLPTEQQLRAYDVSMEDTLQAEPPKVPEVVIKVWKELLQAVHDRQLTRLLLQHMVTSMLQDGDPSSLRCQTLLAWLRLLLIYHTANYAKMSEEREGQAELYSGPVEFSRYLLRATCVQNPNILTCSLLRLVGDSGSFSEDTFRKLDDLRNVYKGGATACPDKGQSDEETDGRKEEESTRKGLSTTDSKTNLTDRAAAEESIWKLRTDPVDWEWVPVGVLPTEAGVAGLASSAEHHAPSYSSTSEDEDGGSSEDEPDSTTLDPSSAQDTNREKGSENPEKDDMVKKIRLH